MKPAVPRSILIYGIAMMGFGFLGYLQGSATSLYAGTGIGLLIVITSFFATKKTGAYLSLALIAALTILFAVRYSLTVKATPGFLGLFSAAMLIYLLIQLGNWRK